MVQIKQIINKIKLFIINRKINAMAKLQQLQNDSVAVIEEVKQTNFTKRIPKFVATTCCGLLIGMTPSLAFAASNGTDTIDKFIDFACSWLIKIGAVIMLVGGVMFALGWQREDSEGKTRGLQTLMAGAMVAALGAAPDVFGL